MMKPVSFKNSEGLTLRGFVHEPKKYDTAIVFLHGFPGTMFTGAFRRCQTLSKLGYLCMRFEFSGTNTSDGKFEDKLMSKEVDDVKYAIDFLKKNYAFKRLVLAGQSTGAIDGALYAHTDKRVDLLILTGAVSDLKHAVRYDFSDEQVREFWTQGYIQYGRLHGKKTWITGKKLKKAFYDEFFTLNIPTAIRKFKKPLLIIHAEKDEAIPVAKDPYELYQLANKPKKLVIIKGADHRFSKPKHLKELIREIDLFIKKQFP